MSERALAHQATAAPWRGRSGIIFRDSPKSHG